MNELIEWSGGNPGALDFLMTVFLNPETSPGTALTIAAYLKKYKTLRGTNIYVLYSDLCDRDLKKVIHLFKNCPQEVLEDACNRQDYSGRDLVSKYMVMA
ncbi:hypothetical protein ACNFU2_06560 [Chryseobacterium sp. PTM-20240506]|uniref:hypothetical protein n=1 Tax=Chryseobacterium sp. PTM-20240506 TaxID=3400631 RepID=UPI003AAA3492